MEELDNILKLLDAESLYNKIDVSINKAKDSFQLKSNAVSDHKEFNIIIASLVKHIYQHGLSIPRDLRETKALEEAIWILERYYKSNQTFGYDSALLDAVNQEKHGIAYIIEIIVELIKSIIFPLVCLI